jgi:hypothetical protein
MRLDFLGKFSYKFIDFFYFSFMKSSTSSIVYPLVFKMTDSMEVQSMSMLLDLDIVVKTAKFGDTCQPTRIYDTDTVNQLYLSMY